MHEEPLHLIPVDWRERALISLGVNTPDHERVRVDGDLDPACRLIFRELMTYHKGDWSKVVDHVRVRRMVLSEQDRVGIGTFQPKDERTRTRPSCRAISTTARSPSSARTAIRAPSTSTANSTSPTAASSNSSRCSSWTWRSFTTCSAPRKSTRSKPKKFAQTDIDEVILGHTNEAEYKKLLSNEFMEALRDRTVRSTSRTITRVSEERKIYEKDYNAQKIRGKHIARTPWKPRPCGPCSRAWRIPKKHQLSLVQKMKLYDGKTLPGFTQDNIKELRKEAQHEGNGRHLAPLHSGQESRRPGQRPRRRLRESVPWS